MKRRSKRKPKTAMKKEEERMDELRKRKRKFERTAISKRE
jgi:hypothetical protein